MRARRLSGVICVAAAAALLAAFAPAPGDGGSRQRGVVRSTTLGPVVGIDDRRTDGTFSWLGIPYAEPPVGDLRWQAPVTHARWHAPRRAKEYGEGCSQPGRFFSPSPHGPRYDLSVRDGLGTPVGQEDCLTLNVFRPADAGRDLPVIVFVHGGSNVVGWSGDPMYDGRTLAREAGAVVVTVNYRLGVLGWLDHEGLKTGDPLTDSGNFGTLDQLEALRFVSDNARAFGGDPDNVTVMGESAGAVNVWALIVSPLADGLIDRAIPMSGGISTTSPVDTRAYAGRLAAAAAEEAGADPSEGVDLLRDLSADQLVSLSLRHGLDATPAVVADGVVVPTDPYAVIAAGDHQDVPVLAGNTLEEGKLFGGSVGAFRPTDYDRFTMQYEFDPDAPSPYTVEDLVVDEYLPVDGPGGWDEVSDALTDLIFTGIARDSMDAMTATGNDRVFHYRFDWDNEPAPFDDVYGAVHAMDLPFAFGNFGRSVASYAFSAQNRPGREELSTLMTDSIRQFVRTGSPQTRGLGARWETWPASMRLDADDDHATATPAGSAVEASRVADHGADVDPGQGAEHRDQDDEDPRPAG
ncbi:para-nitrobenzyl esterase [Myceligenerans cantabricum]